MPQKQSNTLSKLAITQINTLGGPPLPTGVSRMTLKVIMENVASAEAIVNNYRVYAALESWRH